MQSFNRKRLDTQADTQRRQQMQHRVEPRLGIVSVVFESLQPAQTAADVSRKFRLSYTKVSTALPDQGAQFCGARDRQEEGGVVHAQIVAHLQRCGKYGGIRMM